MAPYWMYGELELERRELQARLDNRDARRVAITRLWELRERGVAHRNVGVKQDDYDEWHRRYQEWREEVLTHAATVSHGLRAWLATLDRVRPGPPISVDPVSKPHRRDREQMSEILLRMEEFLQAEMLNRDIARSET